jgi:hypothetical protein
MRRDEIILEDGLFLMIAETAWKRLELDRDVTSQLW